jgi:hypothetical protein
LTVCFAFCLLADCDERNEEKSQSTVKPQEKNKNSDKIETLQNKTKDITEEEAKGKTDSQDMPNLPKCQNKTLSVIFLRFSHRSPHHSQFHIRFLHQHHYSDHQ